MATQPERYSKKQIIQFMTVFLTAASLCLVTILINAQTILPKSLENEANQSLAIIVLGVLLPLALWFDTRVRRIRVIFFVLMHVAAALLMVFYLGSYNPMMALWLTLCIVSYIEFGYIAFILSSLMLVGTSILFCILLIPFIGAEFKLGEYAFYSLIYCGALIATAFVITKIINNSDQRRRELEKTRKSEAAQLNKVNVLLNSISDAILTLDTNGKVTSQNAASLLFFDTNESLVGRYIFDILKVSNEKERTVNLKKLIATVTRSQVREDLMIRSEDHGNMNLNLQMAPIYTDNEREGIVMVIRDITKQKTLEDEKDEFISVASHELRTPIAVAEASLSNLVLMQEKGMDAAMLAKAAETAHEEIIYLAGVVNDLSTLSRAERGVADQAEPVDMDQLFHDLYAKYLPSATKKSLKLNLDVKGKLPVIEVSRLYMEEMIQNLITNAIKYTKTGSVTLAAEIVKGGIKCSVIDTGIGISKSDQKHLGERFFRSEDFRTRETNGTGLGLYVVDKLAMKIGTHIHVESRLNHGSTFSLVVPLKSGTHATGKRSALPLPES